MDLDGVKFETVPPFFEKVKLNSCFKKVALLPVDKRVIIIFFLPQNMMKESYELRN